MRIDRVRKSSAGIEGRFMDEKERAALRRARKLAVKLDLNADLNGRKGTIISAVATLSGGDSKTLKSNSSTSADGRDNGCSSRSPGGEDTGVRDLFVGRDFRPRTERRGVSTDCMGSVTNESVSDGRDSNETALVENGEAIVLSPMDMSSSPSKSSGGLKRRSNGPRMKLRLSSFSVS